MHNHTGIAFKTASRLRGLIYIHALGNTCLSLLAANSLCLSSLLLLLCSHLIPISFLVSLLCFIYSWKYKCAIHFHNVFSSTCIQLNFWRAGSRIELRELIEKWPLLSLWFKTEEILFLLLPFSLLFHLICQRCLGRNPLGKPWDERPDCRICWTAIEEIYLDLCMGPPASTEYSFLIYFRPCIMSCDSILQKIVGHFTAPRSFPPVIWYTHILLVSFGTSWFAQ